MKILGLDYGKAKIGLALGDTVTGLAEPVIVWPNSRFKVQSSKFIKANDIQKIVIGLPGGKLDTEIKEFGKKLEKETGLPVEYFDETLTSINAQEMLLQMKKKRKFRREMEDAYAAAIMLESYLEGGLAHV